MLWFGWRGETAETHSSSTVGSQWVPCTRGLRRRYVELRLFVCNATKKELTAFTMWEKCAGVVRSFLDTSEMGKLDVSK